MFRWLQDSPHFLELTYRLVYKSLQPFQHWMLPDSWIERTFIRLEKISKGVLFDCRMCGVCVLHDTGMTCPMTCPKTLRNGPCGGVLPNSHCEIFPEKSCIWAKAWERSKRMPIYGQEIKHIQPPINHQLRDTSAWINDFHRQSQMIPPGWE